MRRDAESRGAEDAEKNEKAEAQQSTIVHVIITRVEAGREPKQSYLGKKTAQTPSKMCSNG